ncbi:LapA family protein [Kitasatospora sp. NPDC059795]|uniref:LapA family protein n=1 Tax=unclassified Kitasatospora TaxID=2633591 RepID=UPI0009FB2D1E|nr:LapA family protein [Kitasatospora sp. CB01950]
MTKTSGGSPSSTRRSEIGGVPTRWIGIGVIVVLAIWFLFANLDKVKIQFWVFTVTCPLWIALLATLIAGTALGWLLKGRSSR